MREWARQEVGLREMGGVLTRDVGLARSGLVQSGLDHFSHDRLERAEADFGKVLASDADNLTALLALGVIAWRQERLSDALGHVQRAVKLTPRSGANRALLARVLRDLGRPREAVAAFRAALRLDARDNLARFDLASMLSDMGELEDAARCYRTAVRHDPSFAVGHYNLGNLLGRLGQGAEAVPCYEAARALEPEDGRYLNNLADALRRSGRLAEAEEAYRELTVLAPGMAAGHYNLGITLFEQERHGEAADSLREALRLDPGHGEALNTLGAALFELGGHAEAEACARQAIVLRPDLPGARSNLGSILRELGRDAEAEACFVEALSMDFEQPATRYNLATTLLLTGRLEEGWEEYETRWQAAMAPRGFVQPMWRGEALDGRVLLLHAEQGFGDSLQFCRFVRQVARRCRVLLEVPAPLTRLLSRSLPEVERVVVRGDPLPSFHVHCPLMSLPLVLGVTLDTIPGETPYLMADADEVTRWRTRLGRLPGMRVGLVWRGNQQFADMRRKRDLPARLLERLAVGNVSFVSIQPGAVAGEWGALPLHDWTRELDDFAASAALVASLDLVIAVDTAVVHLAGALGRPVWLLNRFDTCWRWLRDRDDSPWYPTLRQFRQTSLGDWDGVIDQVRAALEEVARA